MNKVDMQRQTDKAEELNNITLGMSEDNFLHYCIHASLAFNLQIHRNTITNWNKSEKNPVWTEAYQHWLNKRDMLFMTQVTNYAPAQWIFLAKNWLNMTDRRIHEVETNYEGLLTRIQTAETATQRLEQTRTIIPMPTLGNAYGK